MAQVQNLAFYQGDDFELVFRLKNKADGTPVDLTGCVPSSDIKVALADITKKLSFHASLSDTPTDGMIILTLTGAQTAGLVAGQGLIYDVQLKWPDGRIKTYLKGSITVEEKSHGRSTPDGR